MKVLHFSQWTPSLTCGVTRKIVEQCEAWIAQGVDARAVMLSVSGVAANVTLPPFVTVVSPSGRGPSGLVARYLTKVALIGHVAKVVRDFDPDVTYARRFTWAPGYLWAIAPGKLVIEVNTNDRSESESYPIAKRLLYRSALRRMTRRADGFVVVTPDLMQTLEGSHAPSTVIGNGISPNRFPATVAAHSRAKMAVAFVGTPGQPWHGIDRVLLLAKAMPWVEFHIVGPERDSHSAPVNVVFHGSLGYEQLIGVYSKCSVGLGSLALERVGMSYSSSLKVREYLACGMGVILETPDADLEGLQGVRLVPWCEDWVSRAIAAIEDICSQRSGASFRENALQRCSTAIVESRRLEFIRGVLA